MVNKRKITLREFDASCLTKIEDLSPKVIAAVRRKEGMSRKVFASRLNVPASLVAQWERGERRPTGADIKLLCLVKNKGLEAIA